MCLLQKFKTAFAITIPAANRNPRHPTEVDRHLEDRVQGGSLTLATRVT
jgi:hypothetical protein